MDVEGTDICGESEQCPGHAESGGIFVIRWKLPKLEHELEAKAFRAVPILCFAISAGNDLLWNFTIKYWFYTWTWAVEMVENDAPCDWLATVWA
jgi:hypothetical protein